MRRRPRRVKAADEIEDGGRVEARVTRRSVVAERGRHLLDELVGCPQAEEALYVLGVLELCAQLDERFLRDRDRPRHARRQRRLVGQGRRCCRAGAGRLRCRRLNDADTPRDVARPRRGTVDGTCGSAPLAGNVAEHGRGRRTARGRALRDRAGLAAGEWRWNGRTDSGTAARGVRATGAARRRPGICGCAAGGGRPCGGRRADGG